MDGVKNKNIEFQYSTAKKKEYKYLYNKMNSKIEQHFPRIDIDTALLFIFPS